jgi:hypothetical protein
MDIVALRIFTYSVLPLIIAVGQVGLDKSSRSRERKIETFLLYLFGIGVAGSGIGGFFGRVANLAIGILGIVAMGRRDGFREATVIAVTVFGVGATIVHVSDIIDTGNLAPGNTIQNVGNLLKPALLIGFLAASRRAERSPDSEAHTSEFDIWRRPRIQAAGLMTGSVAAGFGVGFATDQPVIGTVIGTLVGAGLATFVISRGVTRVRSSR